MQLISVNVARASARLVEGRRISTAHFKQPVAGPVAVGPMGLDGDEQADLSVHGGLTKAVYAYPHHYYDFWRTVRAQARAAGWGDALPPGSLGENLTIAGLEESDLFVGDVLQVGTCQLAVSEPRFPCDKFNLAMGFVHAAKLMVQSGFCGSYLAVREPGVLQAGDAVQLRPGPREVSIRELFKARGRF